MPIVVYPLKVRGASLQPGDILKQGRILNTRDQIGNVALLIEAPGDPRAHMPGTTMSLPSDLVYNVLRPLAVPEQQDVEN